MHPRSQSPLQTAAPWAPVPHCDILGCRGQAASNLWFSFGLVTSPAAAPPCHAASHWPLGTSQPNLVCWPESGRGAHAFKLGSSRKPAWDFWPQNQSWVLNQWISGSRTSGALDAVQQRRPGSLGLPDLGKDSSGSLSLQALGQDWRPGLLGGRASP